MKVIILLPVLLLVPYLAYAQAAFQAGEQGVILQWQPNPPGTTNPISLTGSTVILTHKSPGDNTTTCSPPLSGGCTDTCTVSGDGMTASCSIQSTDFPVGGTWKIQFRAVNGSQIRKSPTTQILVGSSIS